MELIDLSANVGKEAVFEDFLTQSCDRFGVDHAAYAGINPVSQTIHGIVTYPDAWRRHYTKHGLDRFDPTLHVAARSIAPVDWRRLPRDDAFLKVFRPAAEFGIGEMGITIPVRGPFGDIGTLSFTRKCDAAEWDALIAQHISEMQSITIHMHDTVMRSDALSNMLRPPSLSRRESEILQWTAAGKTQADIGGILSISSRTVEVHLRSAREKLYSLTTAQAVARAIAMGLIYPL